MITLMSLQCIKWENIFNIGKGREYILMVVIELCTPNWSYITNINHLSPNHSLEHGNGASKGFLTAWNDLVSGENESAGASVTKLSGQRQLHLENLESIVNTVTVNLVDGVADGSGPVWSSMHRPQCLGKDSGKFLVSSISRWASGARVSICYE